MDDNSSITMIAANGTFSSGTIVGPVTTNVVDANTVSAQWSNNISYTWTCASCGAPVCNGQWHVCYNQAAFQLPQTKPHRCPVCEGRGKVLFDPENPFHRGSSVQDWACKPCNATGIVWGQ